MMIYKLINYILKFRVKTGQNKIGTLVKNIVTNGKICYRHEKSVYSVASNNSKY